MSNKARVQRLHQSRGKGHPSEPLPRPQPELPSSGCQVHAPAPHGTTRIQSSAVWCRLSEPSMDSRQLPWEGAPAICCPAPAVGTPPS